MISKYGKAIAGAITAGLTALLPAMEDGTGISAKEWVIVAIATIGALGVIWAVPNKPTTGPTGDTLR